MDKPVAEAVTTPPKFNEAEPTATVRAEAEMEVFVPSKVAEKLLRVMDGLVTDKTEPMDIVPV